MPFPPGNNFDVLNERLGKKSDPLISMTQSNNAADVPTCNIQSNDIVNKPDVHNNCVAASNISFDKTDVDIDDDKLIEENERVSASPEVCDVLQEMLDTVEIEVDMVCTLSISDFYAKRQSVSSTEDSDRSTNSRERKRARHDSTGSAASVESSICSSEHSLADSDDYNLLKVKDKFSFCRSLAQRQLGSFFPLQMAHRFLSSLYITRRLELQTELDYHSGCVNCLEFNRSGSLLVSGSDDLKVVLWDWMNGMPALSFDSGHRGNIFQTRFVPYSNDCLIVTCAVDGQVRLAELSMTGECRNTRNLAKHNSPVHKICIDKECGNVVLSCGEDATVKTMDLRTNVSKRLLTVRNGENDRVALYSIALRPYKPYEFVTCGKDEYLRIFDRRYIQKSNALPVKKFCPEEISASNLSDKLSPHVTSAVYNLSGSEIISSYHNDYLYLFNADHSDGAFEIHKYKGHRNFETVKGVNFYGSHSEYIISGSDCGNIFIWDKNSTDVVWYDKGDSQGAVNVLEPHPTFPIIATSGLEHTIKIWYPSRQKPANLSSLGKVMRDNQISRIFEENNLRAIDRDFIASFMRPLGQRLRRFHARGGEDGSSSSSEQYADSDTSSDPDADSTEPYARIRCTTS